MTIYYQPISGTFTPENLQFAAIVSAPSLNGPWSASNLSALIAPLGLQASKNQVNDPFGNYIGNVYQVGTQSYQWTTLAAAQAAAEADCARIVQNKLNQQTAAALQNPMSSPYITGATVLAPPA